MPLEQTLQQFGLDSKETKVYLAMLQVGQGSVLTISKKAGIKRPTAYLVLEGLMRRGLVSKVPRKNKTFFVAEDPEKLIQILERTKKSITQSLPELRSIYNVKSNKPTVRLYEGMEGVRQVYEIAATDGQGKEIWWFANQELLHQKLPDIPRMFIDLLKSKKMGMRELIGSSEVEQKFAAKNAKTRYQFRHSTVSPDIDFCIVGNKVMIISLKEPIYGVVIEDALIASSFRTLYELAWKSGQKTKLASKSLRNKTNRL